MYSYRKILPKYINIVNPTFIFEWGPGKSTKLILDNISTNSKLVSVEHDQKYFDLIRSQITDSRWEGKLIPVTGRVCQYAHIAKTYPKIDIAFVDGRRRVECVFAALTHLAPNGLIILHDASRKSYTDIINPFIDVLEFSDDTLVFKNKFILD